MAEKIINASQSPDNLNFETAQKIIRGILTEKRIKTPLDKGIIKGNASPPKPEIIVKPYTS